MNSKNVQEALMEAMINFAIAEKSGDHFAAGYHMGKVHAYITALGENARIRSPWHSLWRHVFSRLHFEYLLSYRRDGERG